MPGSSSGRWMRTPGPGSLLENLSEPGTGDSLTYKLVPAADTTEAEAAASKFDINKSTGQILTKDALNTRGRECSYRRLKSN